MRVLSLFDGISCGQLALNKASINYSKYYASEIDQNAILVTQHNFSNTIQIGDITKINITSLPEIDLLIGGSPCQSLSFAGNKEGFKTIDNIEVCSLNQFLTLKNQKFKFLGHSWLIWEYINILNILKPKYFLLENVLMAPKWKEIITSELKVNPTILNSSFVSFQFRKRIYWTNIFIENLIDNNINYYDNFSKVYDPTLILKNKGLNKIYKSRARIASIKDKKLPTLLKNQERKSTDAIIIKQDNIYRYPTRDELEDMQTVKRGYTNIVNYNVAAGLLGNGWTVDIIAHILKKLK